MISIRKATPEDRPLLESSAIEMLKDGVAMDAVVPFAPTKENAAAFFDLVLTQAIEAGDPVLVASSDGDDVGCLFWTEVRGPFTMVERGAYGWGCYVRPSHRRLGVSSQLRSAGEAMLRRAGVAYIDGAVDNQNRAGVASAISHGMLPCATVFRKRI